VLSQIPNTRSDRGRTAADPLTELEEQPILQRARKNSRLSLNATIKRVLAVLFTCVITIRELEWQHVCQKRLRSAARWLSDGR
jgi:hypothetical protein